MENACKKFQRKTINSAEVELLEILILFTKKIREISIKNQREKSREIRRVVTSWINWFNTYSEQASSTATANRLIQFFKRKRPS